MEPQLQPLELLKRLDKARARATALAAQKQGLYDAFEREHAALFAEVQLTKDLIDSLEDEVRATAMESFRETGDTKPLPGVQVKLVRSLAYEEDIALQWATEHGLFLALDKRAFEKMAKTTPPEFVTVMQIPRVFVARALEKAIGGKE